MPECGNAANTTGHIGVRKLLEEQEGEEFIHRTEIRAPMTLQLCGVAEPWAWPMCSCDKYGFLVESLCV